MGSRTASVALAENYVQKFSKAKSAVVLTRVGLVACGVVWLALLAQVKFVLPWTPIPITGQTFGVAVLALLFGSRLSIASVGGYLMAGAVGLPVFAGLRAGFVWGPTAGYLVGMLLASAVVGALADRGWSQSFSKSLLACYIGSALTFSVGLFVLSFFVPSSALLAAGLVPFLPGDLMKNILAAGLVSRLSKN